MNQATLLERLDAVPAGAVFVYRHGVLPVVTRGAGALCAEAAREISRLKAELRRWKDAREASLGCEKITLDELKSMRRELEALKIERYAYLKALKEIADEQFGTVDECIEFADRCIRQMGGYR
jgi:hypothetical protein